MSKSRAESSSRDLLRQNAKIMSLPSNQFPSHPVSIGGQPRESFKGQCSQVYSLACVISSIRLPSSTYIYQERPKKNLKRPSDIATTALARPLLDPIAGCQAHFPITTSLERRSNMAESLELDSLRSHSCVLHLFLLSRANSLRFYLIRPID
jgi:hypothetical protein